jgi:hypothetical protein
VQHHVYRRSTLQIPLLKTNIPLQAATRLEMTRLEMTTWPQEPRPQEHWPQELWPQELWPQELWLAPPRAPAETAAVFHL